MRKDIRQFQRDEEESSLQVNLDKFSNNIKRMATISAVLISLIKFIRISIELLFVSQD